jgi:hypothetical protein
MSGVDELRAQGPTAVGTTLVFTTRGKQRTGQIVALDPGRSVTLRSIQGGVTADYVYACVQHDKGTRVSLVADSSITGPLRLLGPVIRYAIRQADSGQLDAASQGGPGGERHGLDRGFPQRRQDQAERGEYLKRTDAFTTWMAPKKSTNPWTGDRATWMLDLERELARGWGCGPPE